MVTVFSLCLLTEIDQSIVLIKNIMKKSLDHKILDIGCQTDKIINSIKSVTMEQWWCRDSAGRSSMNTCVQL